jgi:hypothetical protein
MVNLINMPVSRERMEQYQNRHVRQLEHASKVNDAREMRSKNNNTRKEWMERQNNASYRNEYDRVRGELSRNKILYRSMQQLQQRESDLKKLFSSGNV